MNKFTMLVGVAGCGKSTYANILKKMGAKIVSSDAIRGELWGDENDQQNPQKVFEECHRRIKKLLREDNWVVFDATNLSARRRESFLKQIDKLANYKECIVILTPPEVIMERMEYRDRKVPEEVVHKQICGFQCPLYYEGWDDITLLWDSSCEFYDIDDYIWECHQVENDNKNHSTETIGDHIDASLFYFAANYGYRKDIDADLVAEAVKYHDVGKPQTKVFHNAKGIPTEEAHYYGHQNYSAYIYLMTHYSLLKDEDYTEKLCTVANLIQFHMEHFFRSPDSLKKFYEKIGLGKELAIIHKCDMAGH